MWVSSDGFKKDSTYWTDDEVMLLGWVLTDGHYIKQKSKYGIEYSSGRVGVTQTKIENLGRITGLFSRLGDYTYRTQTNAQGGVQHVWVTHCPAAYRIRDLAPDKTLTSSLLMSMSSRQMELLYQTMLLGDGCWDSQAGRYRKFVAGTESRANAFLMLCALIGQPARAIERNYSNYAKKQYASMGNIPNTKKCWLVELVKNKRA